MKNWMKLNLLSSAIALALASQVQAAAISQTTQTGNGSSLIFTLFDTTSPTAGGYSYVLDLGTLMGNVTAGTAPTTYTLTGLTSSTFTAPGGTAFTWDVGAATTSNSTYQGFKVLTTFDATATLGPTSPTNTGVKNMANGLTSFVTNINAVFTTSGPGIMNGTGQTASGGYLAYDANGDAGASRGSNWGSTFANSNDGGTYADGATLSLWLMNNTGTTGSAKPTLTNEGTLTLHLNGANAATLTFAPTAVPVPAAIWLMGSALVGVVGVRRRNA